MNTCDQREDNLNMICGTIELKKHENIEHKLGVKRGFTRFDKNIISSANP